MLQIPVWWLCLTTGLSYWWWPVSVTLVVAVVPGARQRVRAAELVAVPAGWSAAVAGICLIALAWLHADFRRWSPPVPRVSHTYYGDLLFHLSLAADAKRALPPTLPQVAGEPLPYHWLAHVDIAIASSATGVELSTILLQLWVPTMVLAGVVAVAACGSRLSRRLWARPLAALLIYGVGEVGAASWSASPFTPMTQFYAWASPRKRFRCCSPSRP